MIAVVFGYMHWNQKLANVPKEEIIVSTNITNTKGKSEKNTVESTYKIEDLTTSLPADVATFIAEAAKSGETVELVIMGSQANTMGDRAWPTIFQEEMKLAYDNLFNITVYGDEDVITTIDVVNGNLHIERLDVTPDIIILEPWILNNNGDVLIEHTMEHIKWIVEDLEAVNEDAFIFLQPANPLFNAIKYPLEVDELKAWSNQEGHHFIDHWNNWPDYMTEEIKGYILENGYAPIELGHQVWAEYVGNLFIAKEEME